MRTCDPLLPKQVRYQAALRSAKAGRYSGYVPRLQRLGGRRTLVDHGGEESFPVRAAKLH